MQSFTVFNPAPLAFKSPILSVFLKSYLLSRYGSKIEQIEVFKDFSESVMSVLIPGLQISY